MVVSSYNHCHIHQWCVLYRGSSEKWQIWVQWWHFWRLLVTVDFDDSFNTKVWSVDHIIIVIYINGVCYRGSSEMSQIHVQWWHFWRLLVTVDFDSISLQKYGQSQSTYILMLLLALYCTYFCILAHLKIANDFIKMSPYEELVALHCCFYLHSHASSGTLLHILRTYDIFVYFALVPSHALGA